DHYDHVRSILRRCQETRITLNPRETKLADKLAKFTSRTHFPWPVKLNAIQMFPAPGNITDLRSFVGLAEEMTGFSKEFS
ncbi:hypothetical protein TCAL_15364, partial [Tigriopus californicus]